MPHRRFDLPAAAAYLHLSESDVEALVRDGAIPFEKRGKRVVFVKKDLDAWASQRILGLTPRGLEGYHRVTSARVHRLSRRRAIISEILRREALHPALSSKTKASIIADMVRLGEATGLIVQRQELIEALRAREALCSTGMPGGLALLHPRHHDPYMFTESFIAVGRTVQPIHFGAPDGKPTDVFFLICCQDDSIHLHVLARLCVMCAQTRLLEMLRRACDAETMFNALVASEAEVIADL